MEHFYLEEEIKIDSVEPNSFLKKTTTFNIEPRRQSKFLNRNEIKIVILGERETGKSSFVIRYVNGRFEPFHIVTIETEYFSKPVHFEPFRPKKIALG